MGSGDGKYFPGGKCAAGCAAGPAGARRAAAAALRWPRLPRSDSRCGGGAKSRPSMPGPGPGPPPPPGSSAAGARGRLGARAARGRRAGGGVRVTGGGGGAGQQAGGLGSSAGGRAPSRRPPCGSIVCGGKQRSLGHWGLGPFPALQPPAAPSHGQAPRRVSPRHARELGHPPPGSPRAHAPARPRSARRSPGEPSAPLAASPARPRGSLRRGRRGKRLLAPRGDKTPNLRSHHARTHSHTHSRAHPLPSPAAQRRLRGRTGSARAPSPSRRVQLPRHPPRRGTVLIKRVILLIVTQEFFFITFRFSPFPSPHAFSSSFF